MAEFNLKMIKIFFVLVIAMLVLAMTSGMNILRNRKFFDWQKMKMESDYIKYKRELAAKVKGFSGAKVADASVQSAASVPVLLYHGVISDQNWKGDNTNISLSVFREEMFGLKERGYQTVTISDFLDYMKKRKELPKKSFLLTFDDGRKDSYYLVDPILRALGYNAVMFVITGQSLDPANDGSSDFYLTQEELQQMSNSGRWEIESHGHAAHDFVKISQSGQEGHFMSNRLWLAAENRMETEAEARKRILGDLALSKSLLEKNLKKKVVGFAYPFNDYGQESQNFSASQQFIRENIANIYPLTFVQVANSDPAGNYPDPDEFYIKRLDVNEDLSSGELLRIVAQNEEKNIPYMDTFINDRGWVSRWGKAKIWGDLAVGDKDGEKSGSLTVLLGTASWKNYTFRAIIRMHSGNEISQVVNYQDDDNFASCNFSASGVSVAEKINGEEFELASAGITIDLPPDRDIMIETVSRGNLISCIENGTKVLEARTKGAGSGGIGFSTWDELPSQSLVDVKKVDVSSL